MRTSRDLKWENETYKLKRSIAEASAYFVHATAAKCTKTRNARAKRAELLCCHC